MTTRQFLTGTLVVLLLAAIGLVSPAMAQPAKIFLASTGADTNDGSRAAPKRSLQSAHDAVAAAGEIVILDTAGYGAVTIAKSVAVVVPPGVSGFVTMATGYGVLINAGPTDVVSLSGLIVEGVPTDYRSPDGGIVAKGVGTLIVENCILRGRGATLSLETPTASRLVVRNSALRGNFIMVKSSGTSVATAEVIDTEITGGAYAILAYASTASSQVRAILTRSVISLVSQVVRSIGTTATVFDGCTLTRNAELFYVYEGSGKLYTRGNNTQYGNGAIGTTPITLNGL